MKNFIVVGGQLIVVYALVVIAHSAIVSDYNVFSLTFWRHLAGGWSTSGYLSLCFLLAGYVILQWFHRGEYNFLRWVREGGYNFKYFGGDELAIVFLGTLFFAGSCSTIVHKSATEVGLIGDGTEVQLRIIHKWEEKWISESGNREHGSSISRGVSYLLFLDGDCGDQLPVRENGRERLLEGCMVRAGEALFNSVRVGNRISVVKRSYYYVPTEYVRRDIRDYSFVMLFWILVSAVVLRKHFHHRESQTNV